MAQANYDQNPTDWRDTFNLALYHLATDQFHIAETLYCQALTTGAPSVRIGAAIRNLQNFSTLFPDHLQSQEMLRLLQESIPDSL